MLIGTRVMAMAEAGAPAQAHGRYLATVQYSVTAAQLLALPWLATRLPARAVSGHRVPTS